MNDLIYWYKKVLLENYINFNGRARRSEYWYFALGNALINIAFFILTAILSLISDSLGGLIYIISSIYSLAVLIPGVAVAIRRLHDIGKSGWFLLVAFIPIIGIFLLIYWLATEGTPGANEYGHNPKEHLDTINAIGIDEE